MLLLLILLLLSLSLLLPGNLLTSVTASHDVDGIYSDFIDATVDVVVVVVVATTLPFVWLW